MKLVVHPDYLPLAPWLRQLPDHFESAGRLLYKGRNTLKVMEEEGFQLNVKRFATPSLINRFMYGFIRKSKARRSYEYALKLLEAGIETPQPVAYLELKRYGLLEESYYISLQCPYSRLFREFADGSSIKGREDIIEAFGLMAARLHEAGILHKDLSIGNILFEKEATGIHLALVDLNRMRFGPISWRKGIKNLARLRGEPAFFEVLVRSYAAARGVDPERSLVWLLKDQQRSVRRFKRKARWKRLFLERSGRQVTS